MQPQIGCGYATLQFAVAASVKRDTSSSSTSAGWGKHGSNRLVQVIVRKCRAPQRKGRRRQRLHQARLCKGSAQRSSGSRRHITAFHHQYCLLTFISAQDAHISLGFSRLAARKRDTVSQNGAARPSPDGKEISKSFCKVSKSGLGHDYLRTEAHTPRSKSYLTSILSYENSQHLATYRLLGFGAKLFYLRTFVPAPKTFVLIS